MGLDNYNNNDERKRWLKNARKSIRNLQQN